MATGVGGSRDLLELIDDAPLGAPYWRGIGVLVLASLFDYFDFFVIGFIVAVIGPAWHLTYVQTSVVLLSAGLGSIVGAIAWGVLSDILGRKRMLIWSLLISGASSGAVSFVADGDWLTFAVLRFVVGVGVAGATTSAITLAVELTPKRVRTILTSALIIPVSVGISGAAILSAVLLPRFGWRGLALTGFAPLLLIVPAMLLLPESTRWLMSRARVEDARANAARLFRMPLSIVPYPPPVSPPVRVNLRDLYAVPRRFWFIVLLWFGFSTASYGVILWGPTLLALVLSTSPAEAARLFVYVSLSGLAGRIVFTLLPNWIGRRATGQIIGVGIALTLGAAAIFFRQSYAGTPLILAFLVAGAPFFDGGAANLGPLSAEVYPARLAARGAGLGQAANGVGKIVGPLMLAIIAGANNYVTPKATIEAAGPALAFLAACGVLVWLAFAVLGIETHRRTMRLDDGDDGHPSHDCRGSIRSPGA